MGTPELDTTTILTRGNRPLRRGWRDFALQIGIWFGFLGLYQIVRGLVNREPAEAFANGLKLIEIESAIGSLVELTLQNMTETTRWLNTIAAFTYWNSEFTVIGLALLWVYFRRHDHFHALRNWLLLTNVIGLLGYALLPTAPPRLFPDFGFADSLAAFGGLNHGSGLVNLASNPYAAMPSLHAAGALIVGLSVAWICKRWWWKALWLAWPGWVFFCVMATANHFWLDIVGGIIVAAVAFVILRWGRRVLPAPGGRRSTA